MSTTTLTAFWQGFATATLEWAESQTNLFALIFGTFIGVFCLILLIYGMTYFFKRKR